MKKNLIVIFLAISSSVCLQAQSIAGTWIFNGPNMNITMLLNPDGTGEFQGIPVRYKVQNGQLYVDDGETISSASQKTGKTARYPFSKANNENGDPMIVIGGKKFVPAYKRVGW